MNQGGNGVAHLWPIPQGKGLSSEMCEPWLALRHRPILLKPSSLTLGLLLL